MADYLQKLISKDELATNAIAQGFVIPKNTLYPYYFVKQRSDSEYSLQIGTSYSDLTTIGRIYWNGEKALEPVGLFITGGDFVKNDVKYHEPYSLKLYVKKKKYPQQQLDKLIVKLVRQGRNTTKRLQKLIFLKSFYFCDNSIIRLEYAYLARLCNLPLVNSRKGHHLRTVL